MKLESQIIITARIDDTISKLKDLATNQEQFVTIIKDDNFLVDDANLAIEKAYISSQHRTIIILAADSYSAVVQNKLLKVIEEPPANKEFILLFKSKSIILPTIKSRLPIVALDEVVEVEELLLDMSHLDIRAVYDFVQKNIRSDANTTKALLEQISKEAIKSQKYNLDESTLNLMRDSIKVLDKGSPPSFVLTAVLLKLLARKKR